REQVDSASFAGARDALLEVADEVRGRAHAVLELAGQAHEALEVELPRGLGLADPRWKRVQEAIGPCEALDLLGDQRRGAAPERREEAPGRRASQERAGPYLVGNARVGEGFLVVLRARVDAVEDGHLLPRDLLSLVELPCGLDDESELGFTIGEASRDRLGPVRPRRPQRLLRAAEPGHERVRERENLRGRGVVVLQSDDRGLRE